MLKPIRYSPDDLMKVPVSRLVYAAADCAERSLRLAMLFKRVPDDEFVQLLLAREEQIFKVRSVANRVRAKEIAEFLSVSLGWTTDEESIRAEPIFGCLAACVAVGRNDDPMEDAECDQMP